MGLFEKKKKSDIKPMSYYETIQQKIKPLEDAMVSIAVTLNGERDKEKRKVLLRAIVESFYDLKAKCNALGPEYAEYFSENWEHCHNSRNADFCYVDRFEAELNEI